MGYVQQTGQWACPYCGYSGAAQAPPAVVAQPQYPPQGARGPMGAPQPSPQGFPQPGQGWGQPQMAMQAPPGPWYQNSYRIRKKVLALTHQYWIDGARGAVIGYGKQKALKLREDIRVYTDEHMQQELWRIQQQGIVDAWGTFAVIDAATNSPLGYVRRRALASMVRGEWEVYDASRQLIGALHESTGRGLARRMIPGGKMVPEHMTLELQGRPVAQINQEFKVIGDAWNVTVQDMPPAFDRRVLLSCALLMGMVETALERK